MDQIILNITFSQQDINKQEFKLNLYDYSLLFKDIEGILKNNYLTSLHKISYIKIEDLTNKWTILESSKITFTLERTALFNNDHFLTLFEKSSIILLDGWCDRFEIIENPSYLELLDHDFTLTSHREIVIQPHILQKKIIHRLKLFMKSIRDYGVTIDNTLIKIDNRLFFSLMFNEKYSFLTKSQMNTVLSQLKLFLDQTYLIEKENIRLIKQIQDPSHLYRGFLQGPKGITDFIEKWSIPTAISQYSNDHLFKHTERVDKKLSIKWCRIENSKVMEIITNDPQGRYHPDFEWIKCDQVDSLFIENGCEYSKGQFTFYDLGAVKEQAMKKMLEMFTDHLLSKVSLDGIHELLLSLSNHILAKEKSHSDTYEEFTNNYNSFLDHYSHLDEVANYSDLKVRFTKFINSLHS